jgi:tRNA pseudouridine55 synthase
VTAASGLVIVDKPAGRTSHDVVTRIRRLAGTRRVGHAGTLDPMATGVLVVGVEKATRLLGHLALTEKQYAATIRLGQATDSGDADGKIVSSASAAGLSEAELRAAAAQLTGEIRQVPPAVSAIKVAGERAYRLARAGAAPELPARTVTVRTLDVRAVRRAAVPEAPGGPAATAAGDLIDVDVEITCSSGTYVRAIARDLGGALGVGGHLTALRRTRVGPYPIGAARTLQQLEATFEVIPLAEAAAAAFPRRDLTCEEARLLAHGARLPAAGAAGPSASAGAGGGPPGPGGVGGPPGPGGDGGSLRSGHDGETLQQATMPPRLVAAFGPDGSLIALLTEEATVARPLAVFVP